MMLFVFGEEEEEEEVSKENNIVLSSKPAKTGLNCGIA
jgi:hypothetical protein